MAARDPDRRLMMLAQAQRARASARQLRAIEITPAMILTRRRWGVLRPEYRGVYAIGPTLEVAGGPETAALLAIGWPSALAVRAACDWWEFTSARAAEVEVAVPAHLHPRSRPGIRVYRMSTLAREDVTLHRGLPVTSPARTLLDVAREDPRLAEPALDEALQRGRVTPPKIRAVVARNPHHPGGPVLLELLEPGRGRGVTRQAAEQRMLGILRQAGIGDAQRNQPIGPFNVDFLWREAGVVVEVDSYTWHSAPAAFKRDRRKDAYLRDHDLDVIRVTWEMMDQPLPLIARIVRAITQGLERRRRR